MFAVRFLVAFLLTTQLAAVYGVTSCERVSSLEDQVDKMSSSQEVCCARVDQLEKDVVDLKTKVNNLTESTAAPEQELDCSDLLKQNPNQPSGIYTLPLPGLGRSVKVYCDMTTEAGGWTVIQRRKDGSVNFYRNYKEYSDGFGNLDGEFWLGNSIISAMTNKRTYQLRVDLEDYEGMSTFNEFSNFRVGSASTKYELESIGTYSGTGGNSMQKHLGMKFTTFDEDSDTDSEANCAVKFKGGWWYRACHDANLNGEYNNNALGEGINWYSWHGVYYSLKATEMKIRPTSF
jgi:outer membrane murein-binding lipoprotein Lpp/predicted lipoprotein with Yx(FWY)xxD motif